jgi:hypothetical protein
MKASVVLALRSDRFDPNRERLHELLQEFAGALADEIANLVKELIDMTNIDFGRQASR